MKTEKNILVAFLLNITFSIIELVGGIFTNSISIISDSVHDFGDAVSIGLSYFLEKFSKKKPNKQYTYGYLRYSILGSLITTVILLTGSIFVIYEGVNRLINPVNINYNGMIIFAVFGVVINFLAAYFTKDGDSLNQKAVNLHMLEDVLGWIIVLVGSILMKFTNINYIDSIMSIIVSLFIMYNSFKNLIQIFDVFMEKIPNNISIDDIKKAILKIDNIKDVHHIHVWSMDGVNNYATMHIVTSIKDYDIVKNEVKNKLNEMNIKHATIELENKKDCKEKNCKNN